jgi:hypothetical protein
VHSDPGGYGTSVSTGTVDIWPNYAGNGGTQPGCPNGDFDMFSPEGTVNGTLPDTLAFFDFSFSSLRIRAVQSDVL